MDVCEIVGKLFCRWNGQVTGSRRAYHWPTSPSQSTLVLVFYLIGALFFHFTDCPHKRRALSSNSNHFPIMQMISPQKSSTPGAHQFSEASSLNTCVFFSPLPPTSPHHTSEKKVYFWCIALVFTLLWWGNRKSSYPINLYNPLWRVCFFSMVRSEIIQMYGEYRL